MNINDFIAGKKITDEDIERLKKNREGNPYLSNMEGLASEDGKIMQFILGGGTSTPRDIVETTYAVDTTDRNDSKEQ